MIQCRFLQLSVRRDSRFRLQRYIFFLNCPNQRCPFCSFPFKNRSETMVFLPCFVHSRSRSFKGSLDVRPGTLRTYVLTP